MEVQEPYVITADPPPALALVRKVYIRQADEEQLVLDFNADEDVAAQMRQYGAVIAGGEYRYSWRMYVDGRYDFGEVRDLLVSLGE